GWSASVSAKQDPAVRAYTGFRRLRQREDVERVSVRWISNFRSERIRHTARTAAAKPRRHRDVLFAANGERDGESLHRCTEPGLPERVSVSHIERAKHTVRISHEHEAASGRQNSRVERGPLLNVPHVLEGSHIVGSQLADVPIGSG